MSRTAARPHTSKPTIRPTLVVSTPPQDDERPDLIVRTSIPTPLGDAKAVIEHWAGESKVYVYLDGDQLHCDPCEIQDLAVVDALGHALIAAAREARRRGIVADTDSLADAPSCA